MPYHTERRIDRIPTGVEFRITTRFESYVIHTDTIAADPWAVRFFADGVWNPHAAAHDIASLDDTWVTITSSVGCVVMVPSPYRNND